MRSYFRTFLLLPALIVALVLIPTLVLSAAGTASAAALPSVIAEVFASSGVFDGESSTAFQSPLPTTIPPQPTRRPPGTVPPPTPRPPHPYPPAPRPQPTPVPSTKTSASDQVMIYPNKIIKVIGDRLSPTIYAYAENGTLYRSNDNGRVWYVVQNNPDVDDFVMSAENPDILYSGKGADCDAPAASNEPMYVSMDGGYYWEEVPTGINLRPLLIHGADANSLFAADCDMLYLSTDGGTSWMAKPDNSVAQLWSNYRIVAMADASLVGDPEPDAAHWDQIYAIGNNADGEGVVAFTGDQGDTWANITDSNSAPEKLAAIVVHERVAGQVWLVAMDGVWSTEDFGVNWTFSNRGLRQIVTSATGSLNDITYAFDDNLYLATSNSLYVKSMDGTQWKKVGGISFGVENAISLLLTDSEPTKLWTNTEDEGVFKYIIEVDD